MSKIVAVSAATAKEIGYCYPSSPGAAARGFERSGCWRLKLLDDQGREVQEACVSTSEAEVRAAASEIDLPFSRWSMPATIAAATGGEP